MSTSRRRFLKSVGSTSLGGILSAVAGRFAHGQTQVRPRNILLLMCDQLRFDGTGYAETVSPSHPSSIDWPVPVSSSRGRTARIHCASLRAPRCCLAATVGPPESWPTRTFHTGSRSLLPRFCAKRASRRRASGSSTFRTATTWTGMLSTISDRLVPERGVPDVAGAGAVRPRTRLSRRPPRGPSRWTSGDLRRRIAPRAPRHAAHDCIHGGES